MNSLTVAGACPRMVVVCERKDFSDAPNFRAYRFETQLVRCNPPSDRQSYRVLQF
jgi:hypothetical protein